MDLAFSQILNNNLVSRSSNKMLSAITEKNGCKISVRNLQRYRKGEVVPSFEFAKVICKGLGLDLSDDEIQHSLDLDRDRQQHLKTADSNLKINISINLDGTSYSAEEIKRKFERIASTKYPGQKNSLEMLIKELIVDTMRKENL